MKSKNIYYLNWIKDRKLVRTTQGKYIQLELGENLYNNLCQIIVDSRQIIKKITPVSSHGSELHEHAYKAAIYSLVYKWEVGKTGLLEAWAQLGSRLVRGHYFTNGNKRVGLLAMINFVHACGFHLRDDKNNEILLKKWERLLLEVATAQSEALAVELVKAHLLLEIIGS
ncbi:MAG: hypothetical protein MRERV_25c010 [Mycoplasmataceae bacterium RV_VA103A]|nr:MAG: hypothetical protein MRERV_25c010 [Mycoplasmataceae bacterium RV_VA103A]